MPLDPPLHGSGGVAHPPASWYAALILHHPVQKAGIVRNPTFTRSLTALAHPLTLTAVLLLLANDHMLKALWPGWVTGKLGDVVGLAFLPLLLAVPLSLAVPRRFTPHDRGVILTAIAVAGVWWALAVTVTEVHAASLAVLSVMTASDFYWERDPSDLVALPGLWGAWYAWLASAPAAAGSRLRGVAVGALALVACVATSSPSRPLPDYGVRCVHAAEHRLLAVVGVGGTFESRDGGLTWLAGTSEGGPISDECSRLEVLGAGRDGGSQYRVVRTARVERSDDGGTTWQTDLDLIPIAGERREALLREAIRTEERRTRSPIVPEGAVPTVLEFRERPLAAALHRGTGNVILAMGHEGLLVRTADGYWRWVSVGTASYRGELSVPARFGLPELTLAVTLLPLALFVLALGFGRPVRESVAWLLGLGFWAFVLTSVASGRERFDSFSGPFDVQWLMIGASLSLCLSVFPAWWALRDLARSTRLWPLSAGIAVVATLGFLLPLELWHLGALALYRGALGSAVLVAVAIVVIGAWLVRRLSHSLEGVSSDRGPGEATSLNKPPT